LAGIPEGAASVVVRGFPDPTAPARQNFGALCETKPAGLGRACDPSDTFATPSYGSDVTPFDVLAASQTRVRDIIIPALPFIVPGTLAPPPGASVFNPLTVGFTVAIAAGSIDGNTIAVAVAPPGDLASRSTDSNACDDRSSPRCSTSVNLDVTG